METPLAVITAANAWASAGNDWQVAAQQQWRPSFLYKPALSVDGNQWCALYGENLQNGVAGFGDSPDLAYRDFDKEWVKKIPANKPASHE